MIQFREHEERHLTNKIKFMKWNPKFDLIAVAFRSGDVALHRLVGWQKVWFLPYPGPDKEEIEPAKQKYPPLTTKSSLPKVNRYGIYVNALEWRPDGKVIAIGYNKNANKLNFSNYIGSSLSLVNVENGEVFKTIEIREGQLNCFAWSEFLNHDVEKLKSFSEGCSPTALDFLPKLISIDKSYEDKNDVPNYFNNTQQSQRSKLAEEDFEDVLKVSTQKSLNVLAVGTKNGFVVMYLFGIYKCCLIRIPNNLSVHYMSFINDLGFLNVVSESNPNDENSSYFNITSHNIEHLKKNQEHYFVLGTIYCKLQSLIVYFNESMQTMFEIFESILLEIDNKLSNYLLKNQKKRDKRNSNVLLADEFLELLVFGNVRDTLEKFLHDFFHKGLKKLGQSIETTYSNMQNLVVVNLQRVTQYLLSYMLTLKAISEWNTEFNELEIDSFAVNESIKSIGSFYLKTVEFQQVINVSIRNVKCFFKWLYSVMVRVVGDSVPPSQQDYSKISQQELQFVADFIQENFEKEDEIANTLDDSSDYSSSSTKKNKKTTETRPTASNFTLERIGQYLKDENLSFISPSLNDLSSNLWVSYLEKNKRLTLGTRDKVLLYPHNSKNSLIQECKLLKKKMRNIFDHSFERFCSKIPKHQSELININSLLNEDSKISRFSSIENYFAFVCKKNIFHLINYKLVENQFEVLSIRFHLEELQSDLSIIDFEFYNKKIVTFLFSDVNKQNSYLFQFSLDNLNLEKTFKPFSLFSNFEDIAKKLSVKTIKIKEDLKNSNNEPLMQLRKLEYIRQSNLAVSGSRKVACVSSISKKRVRIYEMDSCEDEEIIEEDELQVG